MDTTPRWLGVFGVSADAGLGAGKCGLLKQVLVLVGSVGGRCGGCLRYSRNAHMLLLPTCATHDRHSQLPLRCVLSSEWPKLSSASWWS